jgi:hypothetical protein
MRQMVLCAALALTSQLGVLQYRAKADASDYRCSFDNGERWVDANIQSKPTGFYINWRDGFGGPYPDFEWTGTSEDFHNVTDTHGKRYRFERTNNGFRLLRLRNTNAVDGSGIICHSI